MRILITSGGTRAYIDEIRWLGNVSSGRFGAELALHALHAGAHVTHLHSERAVSPVEHKIDIREDMNNQIEQLSRIVAEFRPLKERYEEVRFLSLQSYQEKLEDLVRTRSFDIVFLAAAVSDYAPVPTSGKIPSDREELTLHLHRVPKSIDRVKDWDSDIYQVGFKLLVGSTIPELIAAAERSARANRSDCVVANDLDLLRESHHTIHLVRLGHPTETYTWAENPAARLIERSMQWAELQKKARAGKAR